MLRTIRGKLIPEADRRAKAHATFAAVSSRPTNDVPKCTSRIQASRESLWKKWNAYTQDMFEIDGAEVWLDLCRGGTAALDAENMCKAFLSDYVEHSTTPRTSLGSEEYEVVRTVTTGTTVEELWGRLVAHANATVLQAKRREDPENYRSWRITHFDKPGEGGTTAAYRVSLWIREELVEEYDLSRDQTFKKVEATEEDILLYLETLWSQAAHVPCNAAHRVAFHCIIVMSGICGFRPGSLLELTYRQVEVKAIRGLEADGPTQIVATPTVIHNKRRKNVLKKSQDDKISWSLPIVPCPLLDLTSFLVARALADDAFDPGFTTVDELLSRPKLKNQDCVPLSWKPEMLDKPIISISYNLFWKLWRQVGLAAGCRHRTRPYSLRVGAGGRLDGSLTSALRGYILSNSDSVFQRSYQPAHIGINLGYLAFKAVDDSQDDLFALLRRATLMRDSNAPMYPTEEDVESWEQRQDITSLRKEYQVLRQSKSSDHPEAQRVAARIQSIRDDLTELTVLRLREQYFKELDRNVALGRDSVRDSAQALKSCRKRYHQPASDAAVAIGHWIATHGKNHRRQPQTFIGLLASLLSGNFEQVRLVAAPEPSFDPPTLRMLKSTDLDSYEGIRRCLFGCGTFSSRHNLTRHVKKQHVMKGTFTQPFDCPECNRLGWPPSRIDNPPGWSHHVELHHDEMNAPYLTESTSSSSSATPDSSWRAKRVTEVCLICKESSSFESSQDILCQTCQMLPRAETMNGNGGTKRSADGHIEDHAKRRRT